MNEMATEQQLQRPLLMESAETRRATAKNNSENKATKKTEEDSAEELESEKLIEAVKDWNRMKPVVVLNASTSILMIVLAQLMAFLSIPIGCIGLLSCSVWYSELFRLKKGLQSQVMSVTILSNVVCVLDCLFASVSLGIGAMFAGGEMVVSMMIMSALFAIHGWGFYEMYKRSKEVSKVLQ